MSAHISESGGNYFGILNGVVYRINPNADASPRGVSGLVPLNMRPVPAAVSSTPVRVPCIAPAAPAPDLLMDQARAEKEVRAASLFKREGNEPLRAGHPDLWALLVAGTCLEGSAFQAA